VAAGCAGADAEDRSADEVVTVLAASSLTNVFTDLEQVYEQRHAGVDVRLTFGASSTLAEQLVAGAPGDVLATADLDTMQRVVAAGLVADDPIQFARNRLVLVTPSDDPGDVASIGDLDDSAVTYAVCVPEAPCGAASRTVLRLAGVGADPVTEEPAVRDVLTKVIAGEVDAGLVYASDALSAADQVRTINAPEAAQAVTDDVIAVLEEAAAPGAASDWVDLVTSAQGLQAMRAAGFLAPR
jgi:molybdate transport system substrate-binding protein